MKKKVFKLIKALLFSRKSPLNMAIGSSIGVFLGMLPLIGIRLPLLILVSMLFKFNLITLFLGMSLTIIFPAVHLLSFWLGEIFAGHNMPYFSLRFLYFSHLLKWTNSGRFQLIGSILVGFILSLLLMPAFYKLYISKLVKDHKSSIRNFVFYDSSGKRWVLVKRFILVFTIIIFIVISIFGISLSVTPFLPDLGLSKIKKLPNIRPIDTSIDDNSLFKQLEREKQISPLRYKYKGFNKFTNSPSEHNKRVFGFYVSWDENSLTSLKDNLRAINVLIPEWYHLSQDISQNNDMQNNVDELAKTNQVMEMPLINNYSNDKWDNKIVHEILSSEQLSNNLINQLLGQVKEHQYYGINVDFENIDIKDKKLYSSFLSKLSSQFHKDGYKVSVDVPASGMAYDYNSICKSVDNVIVMMYDEHYQNGEAGPIASSSWFNRTLSQLDVPPQKLVVALGNYGYDWAVDNNGPAQSLSFNDVIDIARDGNLKVIWDNLSGNPYVRYADSDGQHIVWFLDGSTLYNQVKTAASKGVNGIAIWRLGSEDPTVWKIVGNYNDAAQCSKDLQTLWTPDLVHYVGEGEILKIVSEGKFGKRSTNVDTKGFITNESYDSYPTQFEVDRYGKPKDKEIALTFDDGPDSKYTPQILNILDKYKIKATFFIVGENAEVNPDIVERIYKDGNEIGNHTFTHPNVAEVSNEFAKLELNSTQRLIQELTDHSTVLFRPPYVADAEPSSKNELLPILRAQQLGYTMIGEMIDPEDWQRPSSNEIIRRVMHDLPEGNIMLFHDAGGDRSNTVSALPVIIEKLKAQGYRFVTVSQLIGKTRADVMPSIKSNERNLLIYDRTFYSAISDWRHWLSDIFYFGIVVGILRFIFLLYMSGKQYKERKRQIIDDNYKPFASVIIAAYNEEKVISKTINSILQSDYPNFEVIVVNDGSTDKTSEVVASDFKDNAKVRLINKPNGGKSSAINLGYAESSGEIVVALDADTIISRDAISLLIRHFSDDKVAAVSGNVKVGNKHNLLTKWQHIEYVTGFNLERRAFSLLNCITVVPGAIGAWRKNVVIEAGGFSEDTLAEDTDITLNILRKGYKIAFEEYAYAFTEAPEDVKSLLKQRFRWSFGTLQCLWKHKWALFNSNNMPLGFIALPNMWVFQYLFQSLSPVTDIYFVIGLFGNNALKVILFYIAFLLVDFLSSLFAFNMEKEDTKPLIWLFLQRIIYRQLMTYVVLKSILTAMKGIAVGWNKLQRNGNVSETKNNIN